MQSDHQDDHAKLFENADSVAEGSVAPIKGTRLANEKLAVVVWRGINLYKVNPMNYSVADSIKAREICFFLGGMAFGDPITKVWQFLLSVGNIQGSENCTFF